MSSDIAHTAALGVAKEVFGPLIALGRATLAIGVSDGPHRRPMIEVLPVNESACAVTILADDSQIDVLFGPDRTLREIWMSDEEERLAELRACLEGVMEGRYHEQVEVTRTGAKLTGRFDNGPAAYIRHGSAFGPPRITTFEPY